MNPEFNFLVICFLTIFLLIFFFNTLDGEVQALIVLDLDETMRNYDFLTLDAGMKPSYIHPDMIRINNATNQFKQVNYIDLKNIKFFYDINGTILADLEINNDSNYTFNDGTTYGMAININRFPDPDNPQLTDADYIYKFVYDKGNDLWYKVFTIQHSGGQEKSFGQNDTELEPKFLNEKEHYVRIKFNTSNIGRPESFQVQFFAMTRINTSNASYPLIDLTPWIEVPQPEISLSLNPNIGKIYPGDNDLNFVLTSKSKLVRAYIEFCQNKQCQTSLDHCNTYCWVFPKDDDRSRLANGTVLLNTTSLSPATNFASLPVKLRINQPDPGKQHVEIFYKISPADSQGTEDRKVQTWDLDVGDYMREQIYNLSEIPIKYAYIIGPAGVIIGLFIDKESVISRINRFKKWAKNKLI